jgi:catecholate siderophore receptor
MGEITEQWSTFTGISFMDGTVKASGVASEVGAELPYVPHISFNVWSAYKLTRLTVGAGVNYNDGHYFNQTGGFLLVGGGTAPQTRYVANAAAVQALTQYWMGNAMASYAFTRHLSLQVNATNLADTRYADRAYDRHFLPGPGRQVVVSPVITF